MKQLDLFDSLAKDDKAKKEKKATYRKAYREANKEKIAAYRKAYKEANKEKIAARDKAYKEANKEKIAAKDKAYRVANKEKILAYRVANKEKIAAYGKVYYEAYKEANKEKIAAKDKAYYEANKEKILAYRVANKEKIAAYGKAYRVVNKEKQAANKSCREAKRRALKLKQIPIHLRDCPQERQRLIQTYKLRNIISKATGVQHHVDHMWPLSDGGPHWSGNLQVITAYKNLSKSTSVCEATKSTIIKSLESFQSERTI
jgi:hypothetical protein